MASTDGLPGSTGKSDGVYPSDPGDSGNMSEGDRLRRLLEAKRYEQTDLAAAVGVTKAAVGKWLKEKERFSDRVWDKVRAGLLALNLNPGDIRSEESSQPKYSEDLTKLVEAWPRAHLLILKRILESDDTSRAILLAFIHGSTRQIP
jgi:transcriptional regulator with XRE-family HTH domain